uniref:Uncharacterized protein n=1 Tax=Glossina pallidipes TaxID=7398 RepID=A0A1A9Z5R7_GLOPL
MAITNFYACGVNMETPLKIVSEIHEGAQLCHCNTHSFNKLKANNSLCSCDPEKENLEREFLSYMSSKVKHAKLKERKISYEIIQEICLCEDRDFIQRYEAFCTNNTNSVFP